MGNFGIHWNALPVWFCGFGSIIFTHVFILFSHVSLHSLLIFLNHHAPTLESGVFAEAGPRHRPRQMLLNIKRQI